MSRRAVRILLLGILTHDLYRLRDPGTGRVCWEAGEGAWEELRERLKK